MALITLGGTELRRTDGSVTTWVRKGLYGPPSYKGDNLVIPGRPGELVVAGFKIKSVRTIDLGMFVKGIGATEVVAQQLFLLLADELRALYESTINAPKELRVYAPLYGIASGYRKLNVEWVNTIEEDPIGGFQQRSTVRFECPDNPPDWVVVP